MQRSLSIADHHISKRIRERRKLVGLTQGELGAALGVTFQQIQKYEKGINRVTVGRLQNIATVLGVTIDYFYAGLTEAIPSRKALDKTVNAFPTTSESERLINALSNVKDAKLRDIIVEMVEAIAQNPEPAMHLGKLAVG